MPNITGKLKRNALEEKIREYINKDIFDIHYAESQNTTVQNPNKNSNYQYVIKYFYWCKLMIIWNIKSKVFKLNGTIEDIELGDDYCKVIYQKQKNNHLEKIVIINEDFLFDFLDDYEAFMRFNENDLREFSKNPEIHTFLDWGNPEERKQRCILQKVRDKKFRENVLKKYNYQCAICRCDILQLLDAAHERTYEVCNTNVDMPEHGICLCKNHHAMYDQRKESDPSIYLMDIDFANNTIVINDPRIERMSWYREFLDKYQGELLRPQKDNC